MLKSLFFLLMICLMTAYAKTYDLTLTPCDIGTNCKKCYEVVKVSYSVDTNKRQVTLLGKTVEGKGFKEAIDKCEVIDKNNWSCDSVFMATQAKSGVVTVTNNSTSSLANNKKEICLIRPLI